LLDAEKVPATQGVHGAPPPPLNAPALHTAHELADDAALPAGQLEQKERPPVSATVLDVHRVQFSALASAAILPAAHGEQPVEPLTLAYVPGRQTRQERVPMESA
jgi:hypothetical protein